MKARPFEHKTEDLFVPFTAILTATNKLTETERLLTLEREDGKALGHEPGQFVQVSIFGKEEAPISVCSLGSDEQAQFELCVRRIGKVTTALDELEVGQVIGIRGPFGNGFPVEEISGKDVVFIAGGLGLPPMRGLIQLSLRDPHRFGKLTLLYGAKRPSELLFRDNLEQWERSDALDVHLIVDAPDGSWAGQVGLITQLIGPLKLDADRTFAVVVGPPVMYRFVIEQLDFKNIPHERILLSLERHMRCGVGKCGHCMIDDLYCCIDGPIFKWSQVSSIPGAI